MKAYVTFTAQSGITVQFDGSAAPEAFVNGALLAFAEGDRWVLYADPKGPRGSVSGPNNNHPKWRFTFSPSHPISRHLISRNTPDFGMTEVNALEGDRKLFIQLPPERQRAKAIYRKRLPVPEKPAPTPAVLPAPVPRPRAHAQPSGNLSLREAVRAINNAKAELGEGLCLSIKADGTLSAMVEYN